MEAHELITFILNLIIIITSFILIIIYIANKSLHFYLFYCNLILLLIIFLSNILLLIKRDKLLKNGEKGIFKYICYGQAFLLAFFDKLMIFTLTMNSFLIFYGTTNNKSYKSYEKSIFYLFLYINIFLSIFFSVFYLFYSNPGDKESDKDICYPSFDNYNKFIDFSLVSFLLCFNFYLLLNIPFYLSEKMKSKIYEDKNIINYNNAFVVVIFMFLINGFLYLIILLNTYKKLFFGKKYFDLYYASISLIIEIFYSINKRVARTLLCYKKYNNDKNIKEKESDSRMGLTGSEGILSDISLSV